LQQVEGAQVAADQPAGTPACSDRPPTLIGLEDSVVLVKEPQVIGPGVGGLQFEALLEKARLHEPVHRCLEVVPHAEGRPVRAGIGDEAGPCQHGVLQRGDVGVPTEDLLVRRKEVPVQIRQQLVAVEPADDRQDPVHIGIGERRMQVGDPGLD
jgi:hypothetical protein